MRKILNIFQHIFEGVNVTKEIKNDFACSHRAAYRYFIDSIENKQCKYTGFPCDSFERFNKGLCLKCPDNGCPTMGYWAKDEGKLLIKHNMFQNF
jgi:hypothetical protein